MQRAGIDEAGYGPILGPLSIAAACAEVHDAPAFAAAVAAYGADDSKALHDPKNLGKLEQVALSACAWLHGKTPRTAAELFTLFAETPTERTVVPWFTGAEHLKLPVVKAGPTWDLPSATPRGIRGRLIHPHTLNEASAAKHNRAAVEWDAIGGLLADISLKGPTSCTVDRLGGRCYYHDPLASAFPQQAVTIIEESRGRSAYRVDATHGLFDVAFVVGGERADTMVAIASCIAKYARELHQHLFNVWWSATCPQLLPTAGYGTDAHRWMRAIPRSELERWGPQLVRGWNTTITIA